MTDQNQAPDQPKLVPEKDLLALKAAKESLEQKLKETESTLTSTVETHRKSLDEVTNKLFAAEASVKKFEEQLSESAKSGKDYAEVKAKLEAAEKKAGELSIKTLEYRKKLIADTFKIPADSLKDKSLEQLDLYEEALKAVQAARGAGNYALPGAPGNGAAPMPARERIRTGFDALHPSG